ncbi:hypothetical protein AALO_G00222190 [Alosa alosa]|uniref:Fibrinogen C-terminal domain-containing protein n=1 Tax=Alosa alosa TaxID=278164 RepID=A0AAV6G4D3_9TELE|nr:hypothetical protein AALO_G00222190 [Alosa alosa]
MMKVSLSLLTVLVVIASRSVHSNLVDCADICNDGPQASGVYTIYPAGPNSAQYVYCDMDTEGGKWMVRKANEAWPYTAGMKHHFGSCSLTKNGFYS